MQAISEDSPRQSTSQAGALGWQIGGSGVSGLVVGVWVAG
jgi:hypothetical protein